MTNEKELKNLQDDVKLEDLMIMNLDNALNSEFIINMLKRSWDKYHDIHFISNLIGEVYTLHVINKDGFGFEYYMTQLEMLYNQYKEKQISFEHFNLQKSKIISVVIANKIKIDINKPVTQESMQKVKEYFLHEYVTNGYVTHSFPEAYADSILKNGLIGNTMDRKDKLVGIQEIQDLFMSKGVAAPLGGYPYYEGSGIYFENDFTKVFQHSVDSPEWFTWFTSSDHTSAYQSNINVSPYILRDEIYCKRNVIYLCNNAKLSMKETKKVIDFYTLTYNKYKSPKLNVALIPKHILGKSDISKVVPSDMDLLSAITYVLFDGAKEYVEHKGNVYYGIIPSSEFKLSIIPDASKYIEAGQYLRETKEHLINPITNLRILNNAIDNKNRMSQSMLEKVEFTKRIILENEKNIETNKIK